jgi:hypothetical protein
MPEQKDTIAAFLGASAALAGLLLVFIGFVYARGEAFETKRGDPFKYTAKLGAIPFLVTLACTWVSAEWFLGSAWAYSWSVWLFRSGLALTAAYGVVTLVFLL